MFLLVLALMVAASFTSGSENGASFVASANAEPGATGQPGTVARVRLMVSVSPQAGIARAIGGDRVQVDVLVQPGQEPHTFEASPRQIAALASARVYLRIGLPFEEALLRKIRSSRSLMIVDMGSGAPRQPIAQETIEEEPAGKVAHESELDPHIWLSPRLLPLLAQRTYEALRSVDPSGDSVYAANLAHFQARVSEADARAAQWLAPHRGRAFFVYHPAFGYFASAYGLHQVAVEHEGKQPSPKRLAEFIRQARTANARTIFVQPQFDERAARSVANAIGANVATLDDLAEDPVDNLEVMAKRIAAGF